MSNQWTDSRQYWKDKRVVVTGGAGFLGSHVVTLLQAKGAAEIFVPRSIEYDLRHREAILDMLHDSSANLVVHLAARVGGIGANQVHPADFFYDNLMMGVQLLHESWSQGINKFVAVGTVCAYPKHTPVPFKEEDLWNGYPEETNAPYGLAKKMLLVQSQAYRNQYGFDSIYLLPVNLYGPGDNFAPNSSHVIPALIKKCVDAVEADEREIVVWGDGSATREFLYVEDAAQAIVLATERYSAPSPVNIGSGKEISIRDLVTEISKLCGFNAHILWDTSKPNGQPRRRLDTTRARRLFGFVAQTDFTEGLRRTVEYFLQARKSAAPVPVAPSRIVAA